MIITISREFGSGGRELGKRLSDALHLPCYDNEIIEMISKEHGLDAGYVARVSENSLRAAYPLTIGRRFSIPYKVMEQSIMVAVTQQKIVQKLAQQGDCVIIGAVRTRFWPICIRSAFSSMPTVPPSSNAARSGPRSRKNLQWQRWNAGCGRLIKTGQKSMN